MSDLSNMGAGWSFGPADVNDNGWVAGGSQFFTGDHAALYHDGILLDLGTLGGQFSESRALNRDRIVVGNAMTSDEIYHAFIYQNGLMTDLHPFLSATSLDSDSSSAFGIDSAGDIVGYAGSHAFLPVPTSAVPETSAFGATFAAESWLSRS